MFRISKIEKNNPILLKVAEWLFNEWGRNDPRQSIEKTIERLSNPEEVYLTLVAFNDAGIPVGTASITKYDMDMRGGLDLTPRLGCVYVPSEHRGKSIASALCQQIKQELVKFGFKKAYLCTDTAVDLYSRLGWKTLSVEQDNGLSVTTMCIDLST